MDSAKNKIDMINGSLWNKILIFAIPIAASNILQQLFNSADAAVAGRFAGSQSLAAVGSNGPIINIIISLFVGVSLGANVIIANLIGIPYTFILSTTLLYKFAYPTIIQKSSAQKLSFFHRCAENMSVFNY